MVSDDDASSPRKRRKIGAAKAAPYLLRSLFDHIPLTADDPDAKVHITCVEYWNDNLYIGTSAAEILHFVALPPDPCDNTNEPSFILASRLPIAFSQSASGPSQSSGIQQIVILPSVSKACVLCNGTVTFYMLPELSPAFDNTKVGNCRWIGGLDQNADPEDPNSPVIMIGAQNRTMLVRIGDAPRKVRNIEFPRCLAASRRGFIACAADAQAYSLLDVEHQQKIPLFPISVLNESLGSGQVEDMPPASSSSPLQVPSPPAADRGHNRSSSLNTLAGMLQPNQPSASRDRSSSVTPELSPDSGTPRQSMSTERGRSVSPRPSSEDPGPESEPAAGEEVKPLPPLPKQASAQLKPHVLSPTSTEFLVVRGTDEMEPGVGLFVNMDGDLDRGTITFHRYPKSIVIDKGGEDNIIQSPDDTRQQLVLALIETEENGKPHNSLEVQPWDVDPAEAEDHKSWVDIPTVEDEESPHVGICHTMSPSKLQVHEMGKLLQMVRLQTPLLSPHVPATDSRTQASIEQLQKEKELFEATDSEGSRKGDASEGGWEAERNAEEAKFARDLGKTQSSILMWSGNQIWRIVRNPLAIQLNDTLQDAVDTESGSQRLVKRDAIAETMEAIQNTEPKSEAEFLGLNYLRQKASLLLLGDLILMDPTSRNAAVVDATERALITGNLDPRLALLLVPSLRQEVLQGPQGIWIHAGLAETAGVYINQSESSQADAFDRQMLDMIKRFLVSWQQKRGYGSITDETHVFDSVDAALLHLILEQDASMAVERRASPVRSELNRLVDTWKGNFDRAVVLLEEYHQLYTLSRLYQSRKMSRNVLKTWRRIIEGEKDRGSEVNAPGVEIQMRKYLVKIKDAQLVEEYGSWLAQRNPSLGIQVFADNASRVRLEPTDVVALLKEQAPNAVQEYLEHLVFSKNYTQYADDLLSYYLDTVLSVLESSPEARASLAESYSTYRALQPPKPTYMNFITENTPSETWWQSRLRLLQLLGGGSSSQFSSLPSPTFTYSIPAVLARIEPFQNELVSESVILDGLQGRHREALRLLTHGLGDYDSAIRYCLFGGPRSTSSTGALATLAEMPLQRELFGFLLDEFLRIEDPSERIERTSDLLARFAGWFDVSEVLRLVPDDWSVDILSGFLARVFRVLVAQGRESRIERTLSAGLNLRVGAEYIAGVEKAGGWIERDDGELQSLKGSPAVVDAGSDFGEMVDAGDE